MTRPLAASDSDRAAAMRARLAAAQETWGERGEAVLDTGLRYAEGTPVQILVRKRGRRYDLNDRGTAVASAGKPRGWLGVAERVVAEDGFNVNRPGVVFVPAVEGRDLALLAVRLADASLAVHLALLELEEDEEP